MDSGSVATDYGSGAEEDWVSAVPAGSAAFMSPASPSSPTVVSRNDLPSGVGGNEAPLPPGSDDVAAGSLSGGTSLNSHAAGLAASLATRHEHGSNHGSDFVEDDEGGHHGRHQSSTPEHRDGGTVVGSDYHAIAIAPSRAPSPEPEPMDTDVEPHFDRSEDKNESLRRLKGRMSESSGSAGAAAAAAAAAAISAIAAADITSAVLGRGSSPGGGSGSSAAGRDQSRSPALSSLSTSAGVGAFLHSIEETREGSSMENATNAVGSGRTHLKGQQGCNSVDMSVAGGAYMIDDGIPVGAESSICNDGGALGATDIGAVCGSAAGVTADGVPTHRLLALGMTQWTRLPASCALGKESLQSSERGADRLSPPHPAGEDAMVDGEYVSGHSEGCAREQQEQRRESARTVCTGEPAERLSGQSPEPSLAPGTTSSVRAAAGAPAKSGCISSNPASRIAESRCLGSRDVESDPVETLTYGTSTSAPSLLTVKAGDANALQPRSGSSREASSSNKRRLSALGSSDGRHTPEIPSVGVFARAGGEKTAEKRGTSPSDPEAGGGPASGGAERSGEGGECGQRAGKRRLVDGHEVRNHAKDWQTCSLSMMVDRQVWEMICRYRYSYEYRHGYGCRWRICKLWGGSM